MKIRICQPDLKQFGLLIILTLLVYITAKCNASQGKQHFFTRYFNLLKEKSE